MNREKINEALKALKEASEKNCFSCYELENKIKEFGLETDFDYWEKFGKNWNELIPPELESYAEIYPDSILDRGARAIIDDFMIFPDETLSVTFTIVTDFVVNYYKELEKSNIDFLQRLFSDDSEKSSELISKLKRS